MDYNKRKKELGREWELLAMQHYQKNGYTLIEHNRTIRWGEIDLIMSKDQTIVFVEVKVVEYIKDLYGYITPRKLHNVQKTIEAYLHNCKLKKSFIRLDVIFIKNSKVLEVYENVTNT